MSTDWRLIKLEDLGNIITGKTPPSSILDAFTHNNGTPFITPRDMDGRRLIFSTERYLSESGLNAVKRNVVPVNSVAVSCIGSDMGKTVIVQKSSVTNQQINTIIVNKNNFNPKFVYYSLSTRQQDLKDIAGGSATPILNKGHFGQFEINVPNIKTQNFIVDILDSLDTKIELNRQINQTLEAMAQALFKSWFVDFEPVKAKLSALAVSGSADDANLAAMSAISGKTIEQLLTLKTTNPDQYQQLYTTADLFPSEMVDSELGEIPKGWEVLPLSEIIEVTGGGTPKRSEGDYWNGEINWFSVKDAPSDGDVFVIDTEEKITQLGVANSSTKILPIGTTIISARGTVGKLALVGTETAMNQSCYGVNGKEGVGAYLNYLNVKHMIIELQRNTHGAVFDTITTKTFEAVQIVNASTVVNQHFEKAVNSLFNQIKSNLFEVKSLIEIRDTLLPKLLAGELLVDGVGDE